MKFVAARLLLAVFPVVVSAHHGRVYFTDEYIEIEGELIGFKWRNPHPVMTVSVTDASGRVTEWNLEVGGSVYPLRRAGVTQDLFAIGQSVRVRGLISTRAENELLARNILLGGEREVLLGLGGNSPYWMPHAIGEEGWSAEDENLVDTAAENRGLFRVWSSQGRAAGASGPRTYFPYTEEAIAARSSWNPLDNYAMRCEPAGMPTAMMTGHPIELIENGSEVTLRIETWDLERTIHMGGSPEGQPASPLGYSVGSWEGDTLVVSTNRVNWPYFENDGTPQSENTEMIERFELSDDQTRIDYHLAVTDWATFTDPATYETSYFALGESLPTYDCQVN